ncbi:LOW QUALITY PROTEIN: compound eye opsin BCRH2-like [Pollicipes pollicipes]|uniref:LOW QUALITY PROTEIN: compound eye opsin BCRH2-like n=1 Tax=Pollicipes pollicipes TaxID=41117 RepID=UPI001884D871|nr:LOW QUALITY PROTEIN: compound eye opsin BCRH2-like [Pollicipes pollicipes]
MANIHAAVFAVSARDEKFGWMFDPNARVPDTAPAEMLEIIPKHWYNFPPVNPLWHYMIGMIYLVLFVVSMFGNLTALYLFLKDKGLRTPSNMLVINLTLSDLVMTTTNHTAFIYNAFLGGAWQLGPRACEVAGFLGAVSGLCSICSLVAISWDRYRVIVQSFNAAPLTTGKAFGIMLLIWGYTLAFTLLPFFGIGAYVPEGILDSCTFDYFDRGVTNTAYIWCCIIFFYMMPILTICFFYYHIVNAVFQHEKALKEQAKKMNVSTLRSNADQDKQSAEIRIAKVALANISVWALCWTPYCIVVAIGIGGNPMLVTPLVSALPALFAKAVSTYNPLVYALSHPKYRAALRKHMPWVCISNDEAPKSRAAETVSTASADTANQEKA